MPEDKYPEDPNMETLNSIMDASEMTDALRASVTAQRDKLIHENGFSESAAEQMACTMWQAIWTSMAAQAMTEAQRGGGGAK